MAVEYGKKTNAELIEILKSRSLPHTGKKADLVARLQEWDKAEAAKAAAAGPAKSDAVEDVIDWDDDATTEAPAPVKPSSTTAAPAPGSQVSTTTSALKQKVGVAPSTTEHSKAARSEVKTSAPTAPGAVDQVAPAGATKRTDEQSAEKPAVDYSIGLSATDLEAELAKRKARAEKFGIVEDSATALEQAKKALERAKRFGTVTKDASIVKGLDEALPDGPRKRGRGNDEGQSGRGGKRRDSRRGKGYMGRSGGGGYRGPSQQKAGGNESSWSEQDRIALERRKNRFGQV
ncbi:hypothetical protein PAAG_05720 [Paracoccidioides lutzii Pb01]|uniref:SAP domain-containing protein n=1 Tax=Paracoccidioides lutzii (strain ATCC MYA-826 / Pb01) TaxID=502779 RepID=C1H4M7_PARBA|nr:hypothetical protein PAAG_05720 [Paracoccidioides lutzii Pb01]EEH34671.1 hypothetical protein PAAG_05720 [Paracoccidioides lutzii Pb01]